MKTAIIYISKHGTTEKVAQIISDRLKGPDIEIFNLRKIKSPDIDLYDRIIIGGSIHFGLADKKLRNFCINNAGKLIMKKLAIFICGMEQGDKAVEQYNKSFSEEFRKHVGTVAFVGYEFVTEKMNTVEKALVKSVSGSTKSLYKIDSDAIDAFIDTLNK